MNTVTGTTPSHLINTDNRSRVTVATLLERAYREYADRPAVIDPEGPTTSYRELGDLVHRLSNGLTQLGVQPGDRVLVLIGNVPAFFPIDQSLWVSGFVRSTLSVRLHVREVSFIAEDCQARAIIADEEWAAKIAADRALFPNLGYLIVTGRGIDGVLADDVEIDGAVPLVSLIESSPQDPPAYSPLPSDPAAIVYTSGTTGAPKGATHSHANWVAHIRNMVAELPPIHNTDVLLHVAPLSHFSGYITPTFCSRGGANVPLPSFDPPGALKAIAEYSISVVALVPTMLNLLLLEQEENPVDTSTLRTVLYGGSPIAPDRLVRAVKQFGEVFIQVYGSSEIPMPLTALAQRDHAFDPTQPPPARLRSAGRPTPFVELRIVGLDGNPVGPGEQGEIQVRGDVVMLGYWGKEDQTREMIAEDGWASSGDIGIMDAEGYVTIVDRKTDMVITGGFNVYPREIENVISTLPQVQEVAVVGAPDERWGEAVRAAVVLRPGFDLTEAEVIETCRANLASYKKPQSVEFVAELPKTGSGKIMRRVLRDKYWEGHERQVG